MAVFEPTDIDMKVEYPELSSIKEFEPLLDTQMRFVWYYFHKQSPFFNLRPISEKLSSCLEKSKLRLNTNETKNYMDNKFPEAIEAAGARMMRFASSDRVRAKSMIDSIFEGFEIIIDSFGTDDLQDTEKQGKFVDISVKIRAELPQLIKQKEEGFGVKEQRKVGQKKGANDMDNIMNNLSANDEIEDDD